MCDKYWQSSSKGFQIWQFCKEYDIKDVFPPIFIGGNDRNVLIIPLFNTSGFLVFPRNHFHIFPYVRLFTWVSEQICWVKGWQQE